MSLLLSALAAAAPGLALAQDPDVQEDFPDEVETEEITKPAERQVDVEQEKLPDVVHGAYVQAILTESKFLGIITVDPNLSPVGDCSYWGVGVRTSAGVDFLDQPSFVLGAELSYGQQAFNAIAPDDDLPGSAVACSAPYYDGVTNTTAVQGDFRGHLVQVSLRPQLILTRSRRWAVYGRVGGGGFYSPSNIDAANQPAAGIHGVFKPALNAGLGVEYFSKIAHFSVTLVEGELVYALGFDGAVNVNFVGLKYTF